MTAAQASVRTGLGLPASSLLGDPTGIFVINPPTSGQVVVIYPASSTLPQSPIADVGALLAAWPATVDRGLFLKTAGPGTNVDTVQIVTASGTMVQAIWLSGATHIYAFVDSSQHFATDRLRLATNTLLWQDGAISYRLEADISQAAAVAIARTVTMAATGGP